MKLGVYLGKFKFLVFLDANFSTKNICIKFIIKVNKIRIHKLNIIQKEYLKKINLYKVKLK